MTRHLYLLAGAGLATLAGCAVEKLQNGPAPVQGTTREEVLLVEDVGEGCEHWSDCSGEYPDCAGSIPLIGAKFEGGYCTARCTSDAECGEGGGCPLGDLARNPLFASTLQGFDAKGTCLLRCDPDVDDCREGYACQSFVDASPVFATLDPKFRPLALTDTFCIPKPTPIRLQ